MFALVAGRFAQADSRRRGRLYLLGLLSGAERKNSWTLAEQAGDRGPEGMQRLLNFYRWDADAVRDDLRDYVLDNLGDPSGVAVADETGFLKKGTKSAGVQRQYSGTAGRIENCQLGVFLTYVSAKGRALVDRELYLPVSWTDDRERCAEAGIGEDIEFATKPELAARMLERLRDSDAGADIGWFTADEAYGDNPGLRSWLETRRLNYVMACSCDQRLTTPTGPVRVDELARMAPSKGWQRLWAGDGSKGKRLYPVGVSRKPSSLVRTRPALITTRSAGTTRGTGTSRCPCWPPRSSPPPPAPNVNATKKGLCSRWRAISSVVL
jgi:SRSO17 transposase